MIGIKEYNMYCTGKYKELLQQCTWNRIYFTENNQKEKKKLRIHIILYDVALNKYSWAIHDSDRKKSNSITRGKEKKKLTEQSCTSTLLHNMIIKT